MKYLDIRVGKQFFVRPNFFLARGFKLRIGDNVFIGRNAHIASNLTIGDNVMIASSVSFVGGDHKIDNIGELNIRDTGRDHSKQTIIANNVWIGHGVIVLAGVKIASGAVAAAGSLITKDVDKDMIVAGVPAKVVRKRMLD